MAVGQAATSLSQLLSLPLFVTSHELLPNSRALSFPQV